MKKITALLVSASLLQACVPGETPAPVHDAGNVTTAAVEMGTDYQWLVYFDLKTNTVVERKLRPSWDLAFEAAPDGYHVLLNNAKIMAAYRTGRTDLSAAVADDTAGRLKRDSPTGSLDSTAVGDWRTGNPVYIIDRGSDGSGSLGLMKVQVLSADDHQYSVRFSAMNGSNEHEVTIPKDDNYNFIFLSLTDGSLVSVEPPKADWDIVFTPYTHIYYDMDNLPYTVTGCLLNHYNTAAAKDTTHDFTAITYDNISGYTFSTDINTIGFDWKTYSFTTSTYTTDVKKNYIIRDSEGIYYKLHFIDFLNASGEKGNPKWEYQRL